MSKIKKNKVAKSLGEDGEYLSDSKKRKKKKAGELLNENNDKRKKIINMEAYHPRGNHHNRNFKDYIVEFIMIFIAITGGFFMENLRERVVERHKEKEYIVRLVRDIKQDTTDLKYIIQWNEKQMKGLDSLVNLLNNPVSEIDPEIFITLLSDNLNDFHLFNPRDITMTQLKNTGGLRLIENSVVSDSIIIYYNNIKIYETLGNMNGKFVEETFKKEMEFIDFNRILNSGKLNISDANNLRELGNRCFVYKIQVRAYTNLLRDIYNQGTSLIKFIREEYNLKDDERLQ